MKWENGCVGQTKNETKNDGMKVHAQQKQTEESFLKEMTRLFYVFTIEENTDT